MTAKITEFKGEYRWLSNFWPATVTYEGLTYPTVEHAYVAAKTVDLEHRDTIKRILTPGGVKRFGRTLTLRDGWDEMKIDVMKDLVRQKFQYPDLRAKLIATHPMEIIEGNTWGDTFWGVCKGVGKNHLGQILEVERVLIKVGAL